MYFRNVLQAVLISPSSQKVTLAAHPSRVLHNQWNRNRANGRQFCVKVGAEKNTVDDEEVVKFQQHTEDWWDSKNTFGVLAAMNRLRVPLIRCGILSTCLSPQYKNTAKPLKGFTILDVGCGGGLLSEPLARLGAKVTGLDPGIDTVKAAQKHAELDSEITNNLEYICGTVEDLCKQNKKYDAVVCSEVIEHVNRPDVFVKYCVDLVENNGSLFFTTINRTAVSYVSVILAAEYTLGIVPRGTHDWKKFIALHNLKHMLQSLGCRTILTHGMIYNPVCGKWSWSQYDGVNYALHAVKENISNV